MKQGQGKNKGSDFERLICRKLSKFITGNEKPEIYWRSASSGAKATQDSKSGIKSKHGGDIISVQDSEGSWLTETFSIECKSYKDFSFDHLFAPGKGQIWKWWAQCCEDARKSDKKPLLIFKKNRSPVYAMFSHIPHWSDLQTCLVYSNPVTGDQLYIYLFEEIFGGKYEKE